MTYRITPVGTLKSPYQEKFAVPRQPGLAPSVISEIHLQGQANQWEAVRGLEQFSHLWLLFLFDQNLEAGWRPTVRPPRLGGNERIGVFASRATFRPNGIGQSAVKLEGIRLEQGQVIIAVSGADLVNGTPIVDIKPYIPYSDAIVDAKGGFAPSAPTPSEVTWSAQALQDQQNLKLSTMQQQVIVEVLSQDPRPAYKKGKADQKRYAVHLFDLNVHFYFELGDDGHTQIVIDHIQHF
ncbi:tRNA (adenine(37)-N6)-methyltransferase [Vibrio stylophorae]|uniref:tRNA (Adenine(37)-N6)-methyltransferase n=1 Tax=Vibrio stylophorae TaxID=659351 RepID=A0ABN8DSZ0_9VIBR|nr:tRNA (N6-threonylcarbamoyladenosine(37)-N6)-methyltransferase TrmO [Vibrio stylophorae]CAH0534211.1 tRNA (adenine(37)-N6)-methyltransferase [Vibrio stylophorae]